MNQNCIIWKAALLGGAAMLLLAGCMKESEINEKYRPAGTPIVFSASTGYENGHRTRTEYSGQLYDGTHQYERIDWLENDPVTIAYVHGWTFTQSTYEVKHISNSNPEDRNSYASVEVAENHTEITWGEGEGDHTFYAMYPALGFCENYQAYLSIARPTGIIPEEQELHVLNGKYLPPMQYGYMVAYKQIAANNTQSRVTLPFTPAVTAFEFKLQRKAGDPDRKVTGVELTATTPLTGTFEFLIQGGTDDGAYWDTTIGDDATIVRNGGYTVTLSFPEEGGVSVPEEGSGSFLDFTLFALPVKQEGLELKLICDYGPPKILKLNDPDGTPHSFEAAKKHIITNKVVPGNGLVYILDPIMDVTLSYEGGQAMLSQTVEMKSYKQFRSDKTAVPYSLQYSEDDGNTWIDGLPDWLSVESPSNFQGSVEGEKLTLTMLPQNLFDDITPQTEILKTAPPKADYDLSTINYATGQTVNRSTANCYIIQAPGTYKFPLVYGNGVKDGMINESAYRARYSVDGDYRPNEGEYDYTPHRVSGELHGYYYYGSFIDHLGNFIYDPAIIEYSSPYIPIHLNRSISDFTPVLVWADTPGLIDESSLRITGSGPDNSYISFRVPPETIREGNADIGLVLDDVIVWSWHIWITSQNMVAIESTEDYAFSPAMLGWVGALRNTYPERSVLLRTVQDDPNGLTSSPITALQTQDKVWFRGYYPNYHWGRKDPFAPALTNQENSYHPGNSYQSVYYRNYTSGRELYSPNEEYTFRPYPYSSDILTTAETIQQPYCFTRGNTVPYLYPKENTWDSTALTREENGSSPHNQNNVKTIYDPSPVGYKVPTRYALQSLKIFEEPYVIDHSIDPTCAYLISTTGMKLPCFYSTDFTYGYKPINLHSETHDFGSFWMGDIGVSDISEYCSLTFDLIADRQLMVGLGILPVKE